MNVDESTFCQVALSGVMMGDVGAVAVIQEAHKRLLLANRVLEPEELIGGSPFAWDGEVWVDVYIDDLVLMIVGELCDGPPPEIVRRLEAADAACGPMARQWSVANQKTHRWPQSTGEPPCTAALADVESTWKDVRRDDAVCLGLRGLQGRAPAAAARLVLLPRPPAGGYVRPGSRPPGRAIWKNDKHENKKKTKTK